VLLERLLGKFIYGQNGEKKDEKKE
jgi:hypothetical protein